MAKKKPIKQEPNCNTTCTEAFDSSNNYYCRLKTKDQSEPKSSGLLIEEYCQYFRRKKNV